jgi:hypothetical protein
MLLVANFAKVDIIRVGQVGQNVLSAHQVSLHLTKAQIFVKQHQRQQQQLKTLPQQRSFVVQVNEQMQMIGFNHVPTAALAFIRMKWDKQPVYSVTAAIIKMKVQQLLVCHVLQVDIL